MWPHRLLGIPASEAKTIASSPRSQPAMCVFLAGGERKADDHVGPFFRLRSVDGTLCACAAGVTPRLPADSLLRWAGCVPGAA
ncbi:hypothetical protein HPB47_002869 [Ixodes persulcatus]|uniref:Uncharacterized protein n=1 Tax=Ixodes persulcatus TaxID=34615 RepID=A0AC60PKA3_IXOPE|nr:hypothetical protein HPB47_002869 [Ixodes persulcatus]